MRKAISVSTVVILAAMIGWAGAGYGQETPAQDKAKAEARGASQSKAEAEAAAKADRAEKPVHPYRVDFSVYELEDGKKINTRQYSLNLNAEDANELKIGTRVPVETKQGEFQYLDVGTNIWCRIGAIGLFGQVRSIDVERSEGIPLSVRAELSNFAVPEQGAGQSVRPAIRQLQIHASTVAVLGKPMIVGSVDDPNSKRQFQLEVTVTKLR
jgi:hypothetical protein